VQEASSGLLVVKVGTTPAADLAAGNAAAATARLAAAAKTTAGGAGAGALYRFINSPGHPAARAG
jgi:hypothetical protein